MNTGTPSSVAFGALGTLLGYVGAEVASDAIFTRLLWPQRFYNTRHTADLVALAALMPMGGPIHKAAVAALDQLIASGLNKGYCRGDMLGTVFYGDIKKNYMLRRGTENDDDIQKEARNGLWIRALRMVDWQALDNKQVKQSSSTGLRDEEAADRVTKLRAKRPVFWLTLEYELDRADRDSDQGDTDPPRRVQSQSLVLSSLVAENSTIWQSHVFLGIFFSEAISLGIGVFMAAYWRSPFSIWFLSPLLIKLLGLIFSVRRQALEDVPEQSAIGHAHDPRAEQDLITCEMTDFGQGFFLIEGPRHLVMQFYKHYGHPERFRRGFNGDRSREIISLALVVSCILIFPAGLIAFVFAPQPVQWTWLGYQLYTTFAMHLLRFADAGAIGSTESELARILGKEKSVRFRDSTGKTIRANLDLNVFTSLTESRMAIDERLERVRSL